jgi:hypothetical protein
VTGRQRYGYVYGGTATFQGQTRTLDGTAWSLGRCDEVRLRAAAVRDLSRTEDVPLAGVEISDFWFSEIVTEDDGRDITGTSGADPFRPHPCTGAGQDPFRPGVPEGGDT